MLKVYFLGSGAIAVPVLVSLFASEELSVVGVGTQMDRPAGRRRHLQATPVGAWMHENGLHADKPGSVNTEDFLNHLHRLSPDLIFVSAFGQILRSELLALPRIACINLHASLLPAWRGASPINAAILNGDKETGVSFMQMERGLDTGPVFCRYAMDLTEEICADELEMALGRLGAKHAVEVLLKIARGDLSAEPQDEALASYAPKISKADGALDWNEAAELIARKIRAYYPWPGVSGTINTAQRQMRIRLTEAEAHTDMNGVPGEVLLADGERWIVACGQGALAIRKLVPEGRREMSGPEFLRGHPLIPGANLRIKKN